MGSKKSKKDKKSKKSKKASKKSSKSDAASSSSASSSGGSSFASSSSGSSYSSGGGYDDSYSTPRRHRSSSRRHHSYTRHSSSRRGHGSSGHHRGSAHHTRASRSHRHGYYDGNGREATETIGGSRHRYGDRVKSRFAEDHGIAPQSYVIDPATGNPIPSGSPSRASHRGRRGRRSRRYDRDSRYGGANLPHHVHPGAIIQATPGSSPGYPVNQGQQQQQQQGSGNNNPAGPFPSATSFASAYPASSFPSALSAAQPVSYTPSATAGWQQQGSLAQTQGQAPSAAAPQQASQQAQAATPAPQVTASYGTGANQNNYTGGFQ